MLTTTYGFDPTKAACYGQDVNTFFPTGKTGRRKAGTPQQGKEAMQRLIITQFCDVCTVRAECLDLAFRYNDMEGLAVTGVWGGTSEEDRRQMRLGMSEVA